MSTQATVLSISLPTTMTRAIDRIAKSTDQNRSELVRHALRDYILDLEEDRKRFIEAYQATRHEPLITHAELKKRLRLT